MLAQSLLPNGQLKHLFIMFKSTNLVAHFISAVLCCASANPAIAADEAIKISAFAEQSTDEWKQHSFGKGTEYGLVQLDDSWVLQAHSQGAASAFYHSVEIDLEQTPVLSWSWRVEQSLSDLDEMVKSGDDYAARVYVVYKRGFFDKGIAVNYVWSGSYSKGSSWPNAYAMKSSYMLALQDKKTPLAQWQHERRNVREDFQALLGLDIRTVQLVVLMTDTDNSGHTARAHYGDLTFSGE